MDTKSTKQEQEKPASRKHQQGCWLFPSRIKSTRQGGSLPTCQKIALHLNQNCSNYEWQFVKWTDLAMICSHNLLYWKIHIMVTTCMGWLCSVNSEVKDVVVSQAVFHSTILILLLLPLLTIRREKCNVDLEGMWSMGMLHLGWRIVFGYVDCEHEH